MKADKNKKTNKKFDLKKFEVAKLRNINLINGGGNPNNDDIKTVTDVTDLGNRRVN